MSLFFSKTGKSDGRLTSLPVFFGQLDCDLLQNFSVIALEGSVECAITVDNNKTELIVISEEHLEGFSLELATAEVHELVNWSERLEVEVDFLLSLAVVHQNHSAINAKTIVGSLLV